jgi:hypothetical protein
MAIDNENAPQESSASRLKDEVLKHQCGTHYG